MPISFALCAAKACRPAALCRASGLLAWLCAAVILTGAGLRPALAQTATSDTVYQPGHSRLVLPENWEPSGPWAKDPATQEQPGGLLFSGQATAPTGEAVTEFTLHRLPAISIPAEALPLMTEAEQQQFCASFLKNFVAAFTEKTGVAPAGSKAMLKRLGEWYTIMLTARFINNGEDLIINQVGYALPDGLLALTFYTQTPLISVMAADMAYILDKFNPDERLSPRQLPPRESNESLDAYLQRIATP